MTIRTPDQRLRVFVSSTLSELGQERHAACTAITNLRLTPVMFELGARPHPPKELYQSYLEQSQIFVGIYWEKYGWVAPDMSISGIEDEYFLSSDKPKLIYIKTPAPERELRLKELLLCIRRDNVSYMHFSTPEELQELIENDLAMVLTERFEHSATGMDVQAPEHPPSNIPVPRNSLVGRDRELEIACELLRRDDVSLMTLTGPGGTGKSRLGLHIALELLGDFEDGSFLVDLTPIFDPDLVIPTIMEVVGIYEESSNREVIDKLKDYLRSRCMLLLLDNFEQVVSAAPVVAELVETCPQVKILVTSRIPLHLRMERVLFVPPLPLPDLQKNLVLERLMRYAAIDLFIQRAQVLNPGFSINEQNAQIIVEICHRLDGLPLAIELAAARINILSPKALLSKLDHSLVILTKGSRDLPGRQKTLRSAIGWSYDLLDDQAKALFRRLSVFAAGWTLDAAQAICDIDGDSGIDIIEAMQQLVDSSLITGPLAENNEGRFGFLQTIHEYALEQLAASNNEERKVRHQHASYYLTLTEHNTPEDSVYMNAGWSELLEVELDNLRAALNWSIEAGELECALRLCTALWRFWSARSHITEGRRWLDLTFSHLSKDNPDSLPVSVRANALTAAGTLARIQGDMRQAKEYHQLALDLRRRTGDMQAVGTSLNGLGIVAMFQGDYMTAKGMYEESLSLAQEFGDEAGMVRTLNNLGVVEMYLLNFDRALQLHEEVLNIYRKKGDRLGMAGALGNMGDVLRYQGDYTRAQVVLQESLDLYREAHDEHNMAITLSSMGRVALSLKDSNKGSQLYRQSLSLLHDVGDRMAIADCFEGLAVACRLEAEHKSLEANRDCLQRGIVLISAAHALRESVGTPLPPTDRAEYDDTLKSIREQISAALFEKLWHKGQIMTLEQAIASALQKDTPLMAINDDGDHP